MHVIWYRIWNRDLFNNKGIPQTLFLFLLFRIFNLNLEKVCPRHNWFNKTKKLGNIKEVFLSKVFFWKIQVITRTIFLTFSSRSVMLANFHQQVSLFNIFRKYVTSNINIQKKTNNKEMFQTRSQYMRLFFSFIKDSDW